MEPTEKNDVSYSDAKLLAGARSAGQEMRDLAAKREKSRTRSISSDVNIALVAAIVTIIGVVGGANFIFFSNQVGASLVAQAETQAEGLSTLLSDPLAEVDQAGIEQIVGAYLQTENIVAVRVTNTEGSALFTDIDTSSSDLERLPAAGTNDTLDALTDAAIYQSQEIVHDGDAVGTVELWFSRQQLTSIQNTIIITVQIVLIPLIIGIILLNQVLLRRFVTDPLQALTREINRIAKGDYTSRMGTAPQKEINAIGRQVNAMAQAIEERDKSLRDLIDTLEARVAERTQDLQESMEQAREAQERAEQADAIKSQFLASMSHELRTPLNAILALTKYVRNGVFGEVNEEQVDYLNKVVDSGDHLLALINDVLDVTKIQSGGLNLFIEDGFDVDQALDPITASAEQMLANKPVTLYVDIAPDLPKLTCDKRRIRQIFYNLISNAVKFTDEGSITISAQKKDDTLLFAVTDTGPGIAPEDQDIIFNPFVQTETGIRHAGGTGLGLPISKQLAAAHHGDLWVESTPGKGSTFYVKLPLTQAQTTFEATKEQSM